MYHEYPYTTYYNDIDKMCKCCKAAKVHLDTHGDYLRLINDKDGAVISAVKVTYSDTALTDVEGRPIKTYLIQAGTNGNTLVFTHGDGTLTSFEVPYAQTAEKDVQNKDILDYVYGVSISGDKVRITNGDATVYELTIPFATKAATDVEGKDLTTYAATLTVDGRELVLSDSKNRELSRITVPYSVKAKEDIDGDDIKSTYGTQLSTGTTTVNMIAKDGTVLSTITVPYATIAVQDTDGNLFLSDYVEKLVVDGNKIGVEAHDGTRLATITVPFATLATDASNAVERVEVVGDNIVFTTYDGQSFAITAPYAVKAQKDDNGNTIKETYFADVSNDTDAGTITFYDALGQVLAEIHNGVITHAIYDNYNNEIADYIKAIGATVGSDYLTATHGDGTVDSIKVNYAEHAYMDTNNNVIKNTYVKRLAIVEDTDDGKWKLLAFNGDNPEALIYALEIVAEKAKKDMNGKLLTSYLAHIDVDGTEVISTDGEDNEVDRITVPYATEASHALEADHATEADMAQKDQYGKDIDTYVAGGVLTGTDLNLYDSQAMPVSTIDLSSIGKTYTLSSELTTIGNMNAPAIILTDSDNNKNTVQFVDFVTDALDLRVIKDNSDNVIWTYGDTFSALQAGTTYKLYFGASFLISSAARQVLQRISMQYNVSGANHNYMSSSSLLYNNLDILRRISGIPSRIDNVSTSTRLPVTTPADLISCSNRTELTEDLDKALALHQYKTNVYDTTASTFYTSYGYEIVVTVTPSRNITSISGVILYVQFRNTAITINNVIPTSPY